MLLLVLAGLGFVGAFVAGLLGVGGAIIMIPLLLYVPPWLGVGSLGIATVAAISMTQVLFAALSGSLAHGKRGGVHRELAVTVGLATAIASLAGGVASRWLSPLVLTTAFALMATLGTVLMLMAPAEQERRGPGEAAPFSRPRGVAIGLGVGLMAGLVGAGGAFLLVPLLLTVLKVPTRLAIGSSLAITLWTAVAGFLGKLVTGQIPFTPSAALVLGAIPGAQIGERVSRRAGLRTLRGLLSAITAGVALRMWVEVLRQLP
jgi:uncharacterized membrane protein YfcA